MLALIAEHGLADASRPPGSSSTRGSTPRCGARSAWSSPPGARATGSWSSRRARRARPRVVVADPDNAATELIEEGVNGFVAASASPEDLAAAITRVREAGPALRASTAAWYAANARRLSLAESLERVAAAYAGRA